jgi:hypothetical protein
MIAQSCNVDCPSHEPHHHSEAPVRGWPEYLVGIDAICGERRTFSGRIRSSYSIPMHRPKEDSVSIGYPLKPAHRKCLLLQIFGTMGVEAEGVYNSSTSALSSIESPQRLSYLPNGSSGRREVRTSLHVLHPRSAALLPSLWRWLCKYSPVLGRSSTVLVTLACMGSKFAQRNIGGRTVQWSPQDPDLPDDYTA